MENASVIQCLSGEKDFIKDLDLIHVSNISYSFESKTPVEAIRNVSFSIPKGKITAIIGESGSGKSTLLNLIYGLIGPQSGEIRFEGYKTLDPREKLIPGHEDMRMVSQSFDDLDTFAKVWDNIASQLSNTDLEHKHARTTELLTQLRILHLKDQRIVDLSGGETQRVAIARALINNPKVLLLDEPFNQVDASFRESLQDDINRIVQQTGLTIVMVSHDPIEVLSLAHQLLVMRKGELLITGVPRTLFEKAPNSYLAKLLSRANILSKAQAKSLGISSTTEIGIHLNQIKVFADQAGNFKIKNVLFKGHYDELVLITSDLEIRCWQDSTNTFKAGDQVRVQIESYWQLKKK